ncbi:thioredoxin domain-containing protein [Bacteroides sp.]|uniref:thioredoxin domain-containing protein n=2 Tax=Bacteroides sp. TaxID=29523 RepID=UPI003527CEE8
MEKLKMKLKRMSLIIIGTFSMFLISSCLEIEKPSSNGEIVAEVGQEKIYENELNMIIKQELFDELNRIYDIKKKALSQLIDVKLLQKEANKLNMSYQQYIDSYYEMKVAQYGKDSILKKYRLASYFHLHNKKMYQVEMNSSDGKYSKDYYLRGAIIDHLLDSLKKVNNIRQYIYPPKSPLIRLDSLCTYYRGNLSSHVTVITISDFDCDACIAAHSLYDSNYVNYKDKVRFGYIHYSAVPTLAQIASNAANNQGKFWAFHDSLYNNKGYIDSATIYRIANNIHLDISKFNNDIVSGHGMRQIDDTMKQLVLAGVYATPTIIINGRLIVDSHSKDEITYLIDKELNR